MQLANLDGTNVIQLDALAAKQATVAHKHLFVQHCRQRQSLETALIVMVAMGQRVSTSSACHGKPTHPSCWCYLEGPKHLLTHIGVVLCEDFVSKALKERQRATNNEHRPLSQREDVRHVDGAGREVAAAHTYWKFWG